MLFCWGLSKHCQAGFSENSKVLLPLKIKTKKEYGNIVGISCGGLFTTAITDKNYLLSFGCGKHGRLGTKNEQDCHQVSYNSIPTAGNLTMVKIIVNSWDYNFIEKENKFILKNFFFVWVFCFVILSKP